MTPPSDRTPAPRRRPLPRPRELDVLANLLLGCDEHAGSLPQPAPGGFRAALERVLADALSRPPCFVSFSGGRDSSAILALACDVARRHGLALPIPATMRFAQDAASEESHWQRLVLEHLALDGHEVLSLGQELDALGEIATRVLTKHGLLWPANAYMHVPILKLAHGGTLLTGVGGDELLGTRSPRRSWRAAAVDGLPHRLRVEIMLRRRPPSVAGWLTPRGRSMVRRALAGDEVSWPYRWDGALRSWYRSRAFAALEGALALLGEDHDVRVVSPLLDPQVLTELRRVGGRRGFPSRAAAMNWLCGDLLPSALRSRPTKARFGGAIWGPAVRDFASGWDGRGVDQRNVSFKALRDDLLHAPEPDFRAILLVHRGWLASRQPAVNLASS